MAAATTTDVELVEATKKTKAEWLTQAVRLEKKCAGLRGQLRWR
jgi:hypothetical protein